MPHAALAYLLFTAILESPRPESVGWPQWGGPHRDFSIHHVHLSRRWPESGPLNVWRRSLEDGYSGVVVDGQRLITMDGDGHRERVLCLSTENGQTVWQYAYDDPVSQNEQAARYGFGPRATPLLLDGHVVTVGFNGRVHCLNAADGSVRWSRDLVRELGGTRTRWGYSSSPVAYQGNIIFPVGGPGSAFVAVRATDGRVSWSRHDFENSYGSPRIVRIGGRDLLVCLMASDVVAVSPSSGDLRWQVRHEGQWRNNIPDPAWGDDGRLFVTSEGNAGTRVLQVSDADGGTTVQQTWETRLLRCAHRNVIRIGDYAYFSNGDFGPSIFVCVSIESGEVIWRDRRVRRAGLLRVGDDLLMVEETGRLTLATATPRGLTIHVSHEVLNDPAWTIPTLVSQRLYLRDRRQLIRLDLPVEP